MKNRTAMLLFALSAMLLCAFSAMMAAATLPALAADQYYPISVEEYTYGPFDELRVNKVYQLSLSDDPRGIPTEDFERNGRRYYLLDMIKENTTGVDTQEYTETVTMDSDTGDMSAVLKALDAQMEVTTEDGYTGILILDHTSVKVEVKGYQTSTKNLSASHTYPGLSDADLELIPKTITDNGNTLTLADVQWANDGTFYTATATYTGTSTSRYATGYTVTANYTGQVAKTNCEVVIYTAIFGSEKLERSEPTPTPTPVPTPEPTPAPTPEPAPDTDQPTAETLGVTDILPILGCVGGVAALVAAVLYGVKKTRKGA